MPEQGIRSTYSQCPFQIQTWDNHGPLGAGTGFFYEYEDEWFLITNWHIVSGKDPFTKMPLNDQECFPTFIKSKLFSYLDGTHSSTPVAQRAKIYEGSQPLWYEHPELGSYCDVVALPLARPQSCPEFMHNAANRISKIRIPVEPGGVVYVIGFPLNLSVGAGLPLWKSGYIASEPNYDITLGGEIAERGGLLGGLTIPAFFIDSQTRPGMSGSPVFATYVGNWDGEDPYADLDLSQPGFWNRSDIYLGSKATEFIGCYSGRVMGSEQEAALGLCWRKDVLAYICSSKKFGQHPHVNL